MGKERNKKTCNSIQIGPRIKEYNEHTSLHGMKYVTEDGRNYFEKIFWFAIVSMAVILGAYLTWRILSKWQSSPIITSIDSTNYPLSQVVFPAVTICPTYKGIKEKLVSEICRRGWVKERISLNFTMQRGLKAVAVMRSALLCIVVAREIPSQSFSNVQNDFLTVSVIRCAQHVLSPAHVNKKRHIATF